MNDEPPSPGPSGLSVAHPLTILTADERTSGSASAEVPVDVDGLSSLLARVLGIEGAPLTAEASLTFVDPAAIAELKAEHLDGDGAPTDVLSFPIDGVADSLGVDQADPGSWIVGDVVLCPQVAADQAADHAGSLEDELALLVVHAGLHLAGWDHATAEEQQRMWDRERTLLTELHGRPARDPWSTPSP